MKRINIIFIFLITFLLVSFGFTVYSILNMDKDIKPVLNKNKKWRIAYYEGGYYPEYGDVFFSFLIKLSELGWIDKFNTDLFKDNVFKQTKELYLLSTKIPSKYLEFSESNYFTSGWSVVNQEYKKELILQKCKDKEIDLIISMGTRAGSDLVGNCKNIPILALSITDPIDVGIFKEPFDTGYDNVYTIFDPQLSEHSIRFFQQQFGIKKLGAFITSRRNNISITGKSKIEKIVSNIEWCAVEVMIPDIEIVKQNILNCSKELVQKDIDSLFIPTIGGLSTELIYNINNICIPKKIKTISMSSKYVEYGFLFGYGMQKGGSIQIGILAADAMSKIFNGTIPRKLKNPYQKIKFGLAINLDTAKKLRFNIPQGLLDSAIDVYETK